MLTTWPLLAHQTIMQAIIFCGIQGSGKSTYYQQHFFNTHVRISMDLLRTRHREKQFMELCIRTSARFVVDNTNPTIADRQRYLAPALAARYEIICYHFIAELEEALLRNAQRSGKALIPEKGIWGTFKSMQNPAFTEGFHRIFHVYPQPNFRFITTEQAKSGDDCQH